MTTNQAAERLLVDYTKARLHSRTDRGPIERCPECGRKGQRRTYTNRDTMYVHGISMGMWAPTVSDYHYISGKP